MTTSEALLAAVLANPADDLPRLVYADYLEENMETERAEFIRVQVELFRIGYQPDGTVRTGCEDDDRRENHLRRRENQLHWLGWREWGKPVSQLVPDGGVIADRIRYRRGFVAEVRCTLSQWCGGECGVCAGHGDIIADSRGFTFQCDSCHGTGRTPGIGPSVVRSHPVERVVLNNQPLHVLQEGVAWVNDETGTWTGGVPTAVFRLIKTRWPRANGHQKAFITPEEAVDALSVALIAWAKSQPHPGRITSSPVTVDVTA